MTATAANAAAVDLKATALACNAASADFSELQAELTELGWQPVAAADLSDDDLILLTFAGFPNRVAPTETNATAWQSSWQMGMGASEGLRRLAPTEGPELYRAFLRAENAVMRADLQKPEGAPHYSVGCSITVAGEAASALAETPVEQIDTAHYTTAPPELGAATLFMFRPSAVAELTGQPNIKIDPDLVTTLITFTDIPAE